MLPDLLWIIGLYAAAAAFANWLIRRSPGDGRRRYVLVAGNHQMQIEGYIRALRQFSRRTGTEIGITVVLDRSTDETGAILERFGRTDSAIEWVRRDSLGEGKPEERASEPDTLGLAAAGTDVVWVELARQEDMQRLPLWRRARNKE
ncbi:hypothetical protein [Cohnella hongkongensis]|uniref:Uncharacterized protein n=1 Tax=Cohnella hongkongensis TaxID=178337 RepID=A0ABV9FCV4_9BACL